MAVFVKGTHVEVVAYRPNRSFHYLGFLDGSEGVVQNIRGHGDKCDATVELTRLPDPVSIPVAALKPVAK